MKLVVVALGCMLLTGFNPRACRGGGVLACDDHNEAHGDHAHDTNISKGSDEVHSQLTGKVTTMQSELTALQLDTAALRQRALQQGSLYIRWGRNDCPALAEIIYSGIMGGSVWSEHGGGSNLLCLPAKPEYDDHKRTTCGPSTIYGAEYHVCPEPHHHMDIVCALCRSPGSISFMLPAARSCPQGWASQYTGHLMSSYGGYSSSSDYVCVDNDKQYRAGGAANAGGVRLYYTISKCSGTLPCPPYQNDKILSCVVCSK